MSVGGCDATMQRKRCDPSYVGEDEGVNIALGNQEGGSAKVKTKLGYRYKET